MLALIGLLLLVWLALVVVGAVVKGLFWLIIVGVVLFLVTGGIGWARRKTLGRHH